MERAEDVVGADVGDRHHLEIVGGVGAEEHAPLVAGAEEADAERIAHAAAVAEVERAEPHARGEAGRHGAAEEIAARDLDHVAEVVLADLFLAFGEIHPRTSVVVRPRRQGQHDRRK